MRTHAEWKVDTHIFSATGPTRAPTRDFISSAALFVNVMARISNGLMPWAWIRWAIRWVRTRVLPDPAPAITSSGPSWCSTASRWSGFSPSRIGSDPSALSNGPAGMAGRAYSRSCPATGFAAAPDGSCRHTCSLGCPPVVVRRLDTTDGFYVVDLEEAARSVGVVRLAPKVLVDGAELLARATTY